MNQAMDSILGMALQLPAMKKLGEELGVSLEDGLAGITNEMAEAPKQVKKTADQPAPPES